MVLRTYGRRGAGDAPRAAPAAAAPPKKRRITDYFGFVSSSRRVVDEDRAGSEAGAAPPPPAARQTHLALGAGSVRTCAECGLTYDAAVPADCAQHRRHHGRHEGALCVPRLGAHASWRRVLPSGDAIIRVTGAVLAGRPERSVVSLVMGLMAAAEVEDLRAHDVLLYLSGASRRAVGLLVYRSAQVDSTLCALVERVWTAPSHRRRGVGRSLLAALRTCGHGDWAQCDETCALPAAALRFSELTAQGRALAVSFGCVHLPP